MNKEQLIEFENKVAAKFNNAEIKAPIHLYHGNEEEMMKVFQKIDVVNDWVCCTWRNHYQCLLKGVPEDLLMEKIIAGKSMVMNLADYKIVCSSIVGGIPSIAVGIAESIKRKREKSRVWCWVGDMSAETGAFHEAYKYSVNHNLPITFIIENNGLSVTSPTDEVWGRSFPWYVPLYHQDVNWYEGENLIAYTYKNEKYPHAGAGVRVKF
jgi:TPP-dependent pyruvate/acetoin dehydrogenase alpha subunit